MSKNIQKAIKILNEGGIVIFPTDTVYGIGCRLDNPKALEKLFSIRNRPAEKAVLAVVDSIAMAQEYLLPIPEDVNSQLMQQYWPGCLTIVLPCNKEKVPSVARGGGDTLGVRQTNHPVLLEMIKGVGVPLVAPSANFAGEATPKTFQELDSNLLSMVDFVVEGECGGDMPSTVIDCSVKPWKILREGAIRVSI